MADLKVRMNRGRAWVLAGFTPALITMVVSGGASAPVAGPLILRETFSGAAWREDWSEEKLSRGRNSYDVIQDDENRVLRVQSDDAAGGLWRAFQKKPLRSGTVSWRWRIERSLAGNDREREKAGDDYAARIKVVFEERFPIWNTRVISYVWAGQERVGSVYRNPYSRNVATIVLESGDEKAGHWIGEERDLVADYRLYFGRPPSEISGVAIMVDTDNTGSRATAFFDDVRVEAE